MYESAIRFTYYTYVQTTVKGIHNENLLYLLFLLFVFAFCLGLICMLQNKNIYLLSNCNNTNNNIYYILLTIIDT